MLITDVDNDDHIYHHFTTI